ncbi:bifunctional phosphoglucose/phosphomannose isomerase [Candidatus Micrarchaeota archaeon]|nr:bifunctional phosphoglucose/phosphomannose isomerase [Candidatus Micrarchaeota archaeon]
MDKSNLRKTITQMPGQYAVGAKLAQGVGRGFAGVKRVIVCGMGGSALYADLLKDYLVQEGFCNDELIFVHRHYGLPKGVKIDSSTLFVASSYSGNTEESIESLEKALRTKARLLGIATGGKIQQICGKNNVAFIKIPSGLQPRHASGYLIGALLRVLVDAKCVQAKALDVLVEAAGKIDGRELSKLDKLGEEISAFVFGKTPVVYSSHAFASVARTSKIKFNENGKNPAFYNEFPELNHNELIGYTKLADNYAFLFLQRKEDHPRVKKRMAITKKILEELGAKVELVKVEGGGFAQQMLWTLLLFEYASYYLALKNGFDPTPVPLVEKLKKLLKE